jgi:hypothetical protein
LRTPKFAEEKNQQNLYKRFLYQPIEKEERFSVRIHKPERNANNYSKLFLPPSDTEALWEEVPTFVL